MKKADLLAENEKLKAQLKRANAKLNPQKSYVQENRVQFDRLRKDLMGFKNEDGKSRYFFSRKAKGSNKKEEVFKTNLFVSDLLELKARTSSKIEDSQVNSRISMDTHALIAYLSKGRVKRPRKTGKGISRKP